MRNLERWLHFAVHGTPAPRAPRRKPRRGPARSWKYRQWVRTLPSLVSGRYGCEACHTGRAHTSQKSSDFTCIPLTRAEHNEYDAGRAAFERKHDIDMAAEVRELNSEWGSR